jgi:hypothetical protein
VVIAVDDSIHISIHRIIYRELPECVGIPIWISFRTSEKVVFNIPVPAIRVFPKLFSFLPKG